jgi:O-antigen ligase
MSAFPLRARSLGGHLSPAAALFAAALTVSVGTGVALRSPLLLGIGAVAGAVVALRAAPELSLVLLASQGSLKSLYPFTEIPVDLLLVTLALTLWSCRVMIRRHGLPRVPWTAALFLAVSTLLVFAAMRTSLPGAMSKAIYFEGVSLLLFFSPFVLVRDLAALGRLALAFIAVAFIIVQATSPTVDPSQPFTVPGGSEITAGLFPAFGALAAITCLAMRVRGPWRIVAFAVGAALAAAAARAGSRGVLVALVAAMLLGGILLVLHSRRPVITFALVTAAGVAIAAVGRQVVSPAALSRYERITNDPRRGYLHTSALDQAFAHPLGNGIGTFGLNLPVMNPRPAVPYPHNAAIEIFNESGIFALGAFAALVGAAFLSALRVARLPGGAFCAAGLAFTLLEAFASGSVNDDSLLWMMLGISLAIPASAAASDGLTRSAAGLVR